jgi:predicted RNase H-like nuclease
MAGILTGDAVIALGVDGCRDGWVAIGLGVDGRFVAAHVVGEGELGDLVRELVGARCIGIDIPIGLPVDGARGADVAARARLLAVGRHMSVFMTPPRQVLEAATHPEAVALAQATIGHGISQQAFALRHRIFEVEAIVAADQRVVEVHPEVSFDELAGGRAIGRKRSWRGLSERRALLEAAAIVLPAELGAAGECEPHDVLDAAVAAWTALRVARGKAGRLPTVDERGDRGRPMAIWI